VYETPHFETNWHKHPEYELITILKGHGTALIGDHVCDYKVHDVFFIAGNLPHWFRKNHPNRCCVPYWWSTLLATAGDRVWLFTDAGDESRSRSLLKKNNGLLLQKRLKKVVMPGDARHTVGTKGFEKLLQLFQCLHSIGSSSQYKILTEDFQRPGGGGEPGH
jgi:hypothetical protein